MPLFDVYCYSKRKVIFSTDDEGEAEREKKNHRLQFRHIVGIIPGKPVQPVDEGDDHGENDEPNDSLTVNDSEE